MTSYNGHDPYPNGRWMKQGEAVKGETVWKEGTAFVKANPDHAVFNVNGCGPLDSWTGFNERRIALFGKTAKGFSDVLGGKFSSIVDGYDDTDEGKLKRKRARDNLKLRMKHCLKECKTRLTAVIYERLVMLSGVQQHNFVFNSLRDKILNVAAQYYDAHRDNEAFAGVTKEQALVNLLSLPIDEFNDTFDGCFEVNADGFVESKDYVKEYCIKLVEQASTATTTAPLATAASASAQGLLNAVAVVPPTQGHDGFASVENVIDVDGRTDSRHNDSSVSLFVSGAGIGSHTVNKITCGMAVNVTYMPSMSESTVKELVKEELRKEKMASISK